MNETIINEVMQGMLPYLDNGQLAELQRIMRHALHGKTILEEEVDGQKTEENNKVVDLFISAKRVEGCSAKSLKYYSVTIATMLSAIQKDIRHINTDDLREYLTEYQNGKHASKVTIDNIRRILSSFFSWLEDEDYIVKSPVRRIHKVKSTSTIKEIYSDESLETMRDNCVTIRDLAIIDMLASTGMRVGEMVLLNREDVDFQ